MKTVQIQGEKQIKAIEKQAVKSNQFSDENNELVFSKEKEIFKSIYTKRLKKIDEISKKNQL